MSGNTCAPTSSQAASGTTTTLSSRPAPKPGTGSSAIQIAFDPSAQETGRRSMSRAVGITPQKPLYRATERDDTLVGKWLKTEYPKMKKMAKAQGADIYFGSTSPTFIQGTIRVRVRR